MARAWGVRPSSLLGLDEPLAAFKLDHAVFCLEEAIDDALGRVRERFDLEDLDAKGRSRVRRVQKAMTAAIERILHGPPPAFDEREVVYTWNEDHSQIIGFRYADEVAG